MSNLSDFNNMVRQWADEQPRKYRKTALAFGYRCNIETHSVEGTLEWISRKSRERKNEGVSRRTLATHLKAFEASGVIKVQRQRDGDKQRASVYYVDFDGVIDEEISPVTFEPDAWDSPVDESVKPAARKERPVLAEVLEEDDDTDLGGYEDEPDLDKFISGESADTPFSGPSWKQILNM